MSEHTPGKLFVVPAATAGRFTINGETRTIAYTDGESPSDRANAAHLALCWNSHDKLAEACRRAMNWMPKIGDSPAREDQAFIEAALASLPE